MLAPMTDTQSFHRHKLAPLRLVEPTEKQINVMMKGLFQMRL
jgi:hypothetical protein